MDDKVTSSSEVAAQSVSEADKVVSVQSSGPSAERTDTEHRKVYGTAKTENLRDSGFWRLLLPVVLMLCFLALLAIPLFILIPLLLNSISGMSAGNAKEAGLLWLWITMIVIEVAIAAFIISGIGRIFMTQAGNYKRA